MYRLRYKIEYVCNFARLLSMSALIFSADLVRLLDEGQRCRLPPTNVGVRRVREAPTTRRRGGEDDSSTRSRMRDDLDVHDDAWASNDVVAAAGRARVRTTDNDDYDHDNDDDGGVRPDNRNALDKGEEGGGGGAAPRASAKLRGRRRRRRRWRSSTG